MPAKRPIELPVRWDLSMLPDGTVTLIFTGELDAISTPPAWAKLETEFAGLYGDIRQASRLVGKMEIHFICYEVKDGEPGRIVLDRTCAHETPLARKTPDALMVAWDNDLREIMEEIHAEYSKAYSGEHR